MTGETRTTPQGSVLGRVAKIVSIKEVNKLMGKNFSVSLFRGDMWLIRLSFSGSRLEPLLCCGTIK